MDPNNTNISDDAITKAARGDQNAFETIYRVHCKFVYNVAWRIVTRHEDAEEVTQEVFLVIYRKLSSFQFQSSLKKWIYRVTINTAMNYAKKLSKAKARTTEYNEQIHCAGVLGETDAKIDKEHNEQLATALLETLTLDQKACMVLRNIGAAFLLLSLSF